MISGLDLLAGVLAGLVAGFLLPVIRRCAPSLGLVDVPNERSSHERPVPRAAGIGILAGMAAGTAALHLGGDLAPSALAITGAAVALIGLIGVADDRRDIPAGIRLLVHCIATVWALYWIGSPVVAGNAGELNPFLYLFVGLGIVWALNLYNFMDGIDGIALQEAVFLSCSGVVLLWGTGSPWMGILLCLGATCSVALKWNWAPARMFLGDGGSAFIGFTLAVVAVDSASSTGLAPWIILWGVFLVDATVTLLTRVVTGQRWYSAHRSHAYQRLSRRLDSHARVSGAAFAVNILWLLPWALVAAREYLPPPVCLVVALAPLTILAYAIGAGRPED